MKTIVHSVTPPRLAAVGEPLDGSRTAAYAMHVVSAIVAAIFGILALSAPALVAYTVTPELEAARLNQFATPAPSSNTQYVPPVRLLPAQGSVSVSINR